MLKFKINTILLFLLILFSTSCFAKEATFVGRSEYIIAVGTGADAEAIALEDAKRLALEQAGTYLESLTIVENNAVTIDRIKVIARGTAKLVPGSIRKQYSTIDSSTGAQKLVLEAQFAIDPDEVAAELNRARSGPDLGAAQDKYDAVIAEDQRLQAELLRTTNEAERGELIEKYQRSRNRFYAMQWYLKSLSELRIYLSNENSQPSADENLKRIIDYSTKGIKADPLSGENYVMRGFAKGCFEELYESLNDINKAIELLPPDQDEPLAFAKDLKKFLLGYINQYQKAPAK